MATSNKTRDELLAKLISGLCSPTSWDHLSRLLGVPIPEEVRRRWAEERARNLVGWIAMDYDVEVEDFERGAAVRALLDAAMLAVATGNDSTGLRLAASRVFRYFGLDNRV